MNRKDNIRAKKTKERFKQALFDLLEQEREQQITVQKLCEQAGLNRSSFYVHYQDIYDLIDQTEQHLRKELLERYENVEEEERQPFTEASLMIYLQHLKENRSFYRVCLNSRIRFPIAQGQERLKEILEPFYRKRALASEKEIWYYLIGFQAGFTMMTREWIEKGCQESEEEMAKIIVKTLV